MHMEQYGMEVNSLTTEVAETHTDGSRAQHTNNPDGILRDFRDEHVALDRSEFLHQIFSGCRRSDMVCDMPVSRFVFRDGRLLKAEPDDNQRMQVMSTA